MNLAKLPLLPAKEVVNAKVKLDGIFLAVDCQFNLCKYMGSYSRI
jgi:hypothetical protein